MQDLQTTNRYMQKLKNWLVKLGPRNYIVQLALRTHGRRKGFNITFTNDAIRIKSRDRLMILPITQYVQVPIMMEVFDLNFRTIEWKEEGGLKVLDYSKPGFHRYARHNVGFFSPSVAEDDSIDVYLRAYRPTKGEVVWDVGAHVGSSAYFLAKLVGPSGKVYAFEPDEASFEYLLRNIRLHSLSNVIPVKKALSGTTGSAAFDMDGTMSAGLHEVLTYSGSGAVKRVETINIPDACSEFGCVPAFIKMDIEGAEFDAVASATEFLKQHSIHFALECHRVGTRYTHLSLEPTFSQIGYKTQWEVVSGQAFMWASREAAAAAYNR